MKTKQTRREMLRHMVGASALTLMAGKVRGAEPVSTLSPVPAKKSFRHSVCRWCYNSIPFTEMCRGAREIGLESIELLGPEDWVELKKSGLTCAMSNGPTTIPDGLNRLENHATMLPAFRVRLREAAAAGIPNVICFSGNRRGLPDEQGLENCAAGLKQIVGDAERAGVTICMELLNSKVDHIDYQCDHTAWGVELVKRVGSERFKLLYDIYHMQIMEGDVIRTIRENHAHIAHYHTAGNPGRHEFTGPQDVQEMNYHGIMRAIRDTGYRGFIGQEFIPTREPFGALRDAIVMCDV